MITSNGLSFAERAASLPRSTHDPRGPSRPANHDLELEPESEPPPKKHGRPTKRVEERYFRALCKVVTEEKWEQACQVMLDRALNGDTKAFKILAPYLLGKPLVRVKAEIDVEGQISGAYAERIGRVYRAG